MSTEPNNLTIEIDESSRQARMAVMDALAGALRDVDLHGRTISSRHVGPEREGVAIEERSGGWQTVAYTAAAYAVFELRVYLTARLLNEAGDGLIDAVENRVREWLHRTGNTIEVPIIGPDRKTVLRTVRRQVDDAPPG